MNLEHMFNPSQTKQTIWLNMLQYANKIFANGSKDLWLSPTNFISVYSQGQELLKSDVLSIPVLDVYENYIQDRQTLIDEWQQEDIGSVIESLFSLEEPKQFIVDVLQGLQNLYTEVYPLVVEVPSPQRWLNWLNERLNMKGLAPLNEDDIEFTSMFLADYLRDFSTLNIAAVLIVERDVSIDLNNSLSLYQPILNVVKHFQWSVGIDPGNEVVNVNELNDQIKFMLLGNHSISDLHKHWQNGDKVGGGLNKSFWLEKEHDKEVFVSGVVYGEIPPNAYPEQVLHKLKMLRK